MPSLEKIGWLVVAFVCAMFAVVFANLLFLTWHGWSWKRGATRESLRETVSAAFASLFYLAFFFAGLFAAFSIISRNFFSIR